MTEKKNSTCQPGWGVIIAGAVIVSWLGTLVVALSLPLGEMSAVTIVLLVALLTFLYTGLFITAHDAMHGGVAPGCYRLNRWIGWLAVRFYAFFSYSLLLSRHSDHHRYPASDKDPDYHDGRHRGFWSWYLRFMKTYLRLGQIVGMAILFNVLLHLLGVPLGNLLLFWVAPALLSTVQLFYFGTYLPHREPPDGYDNPHRARSNDYPVWLSFLTCYHFGYHREHHEAPYVPWWRLPTRRRQTLSTQ